MEDALQGTAGRAGRKESGGARNRRGGEEQEEDGEILVSEVKKAIKKMKKRKVAGPDGIPNEAWIYGRNQLYEMLTRVLNKIWRGKATQRDGGWER